MDCNHSRDDALLDMTAAADAIQRRTGGTKTVHPASVARWGTKGLKGVRLRTWRYGRRMYTTVQALDEFSEALGAAAGNHEATIAGGDLAPRERTPAQRQRDIEAAERKLAAI